MGDLGSVFVVGGCGLLGYHVVKYLVESGDAASITVFDVSTKSRRIEDNKVNYITGSITSPDEVREALRTTKTKVIIHTASPDPLVPVPRVLEEVNIHGTQNVIDCAVELGIKILVYTSSSEVIQHNYDDIIWADETWPLPENPVGGAVYSKTKKIAEEMVLKANKRNGLHTVALRPCTIFGETDWQLTRHSVEMAKDGRARYQIGSGKNLYDFIYGGNAAEAHILAAKKVLLESQTDGTVPEEFRVSGEVFFITNDDPWPFWTFTLTAAEEIGKMYADKDIWHLPVDVVCSFAKALEWVTWVVTLGFGGKPAVTAEMLRYTAQVRTFSIKKAKERLGYCPRVGMREGLRRAVAWYTSETALSKKIR